MSRKAVHKYMNATLYEFQDKRKARL